MSKYPLTCFIIFVTCFSFAQQSKTSGEYNRTIDSLLTLLKTDKEDTNKVNHLYQLTRECELTGDYEKGLSYGNGAVELARKLNFKKGIANAYGNIGNIYLVEADYPKALDYYFKALKIAEELGNKNHIAACLCNIGNVYKEQADYPKALDYFFKALKMDEELGNKNGIASDLGNIGNVYNGQADYPKTLDYYFKALKIAEELGDKNGIGRHLGNIGIVYCYQADYPKTLDYYFKALKIAEELGDKNGIGRHLGNIGLVYSNQADYLKALDYYFKALKIAEELGNKNHIATWLGNIGNVYGNQADYPKALDYFFKALKMDEELGNKNGIAIKLGNIGSLYTKAPSLPPPLGEEKKGYALAEKYLKKAIALDSAIGAQNGLMIKEEALSQLYDTTAQLAIGNLQFAKAAEKYKLSMLHYKKAMVLKDTLFSQESKKQLVRKEMNFEFEKKEAAAKLEQDKKDAVSSAETKRKNLFLLFIAAVAIAVATIAVIIFRSLRITRKQKHIITLQKDEVTRQRDIVEVQKAVVEKQKEEIAHKNKDLTDSINYAQRIQAAILTSEQYLNDMFLPHGQISSHFILYKPKDIVAGDFYWAYKTPDEKAIWVAADCTGHGVPGAFMSMIGNSLLNEIVVEKGIHEPDEILNKMRTGVIKALGQSGGDKKKDGMDAALCCWDKANNKISFSGANNSLWIIRNDEFIEMEPDIQPIGHYTETIKPFTKKEFQLQQGDALYTFTDGYCDQFGGPKGKKFKYKPFRELLISIHNRSMPEQKEILNNAIDEWRGNLEQIDDICIIGVRI